MLCEAFKEAEQAGSLGPISNRAVIAVLPKPGKDPLLCGSYRPISLLNGDIKILSSVLAARLRKVIPSLIHNTQVGFVPGRTSRNHMRSLAHTLWAAKDLPDEALAISLDAEKAFDGIVWEYLFATLKKFGLGDQFITKVRLLYEKPVVQVNCSGFLSKTFMINRGTRQGCPLSPPIVLTGNGTTGGLLPPIPLTHGDRYPRRDVQGLPICR